MKINFNSPTSIITWNNVKIILKRDDLISPLSFSGNKGRKLAYFIDHDLPRVKHLIGQGSPQSNSLYSLSELAKIKQWSFTFYVDHIASWIKNNPTGNYAAAIKNGVNIIELSTHEQEKVILDRIAKSPEEHLFIPEGGRSPFAEYGIKTLADELKGFISQQSGEEKFAILLPSGTGTTALYLQKNISIPVYTCACVGDETYLYKQFQMLSSNSSEYPIICKRPKKYHFGTLYPEFYEVWKNLNQTGVAFELLYDPVAWITFTPLIKKHNNTQFIYIHQGGTLGNETMLNRYIRKYGK